MSREKDITQGQFQQLLASQQKAQAPMQFTYTPGLPLSAPKMTRSEMRFHAAVAAMQGQLAADPEGRWSAKHVAADAVHYADALLQALAEGSEGGEG